jgi:excinuclease UvrABC nuclease subunit
MNTLIIEPHSKVQYQQFVNLAKKLNVTFREEKAKAKKVKKSKENALFAEAERLKKQMKEDAFFALAGSFDLPETADELIEIIESSRTSNKEMDTSWAD